MVDRKRASSDFLDLFFPIHYLVGINIEDALKCGVLTRQQACILWMIRTESADGVAMRRKDIERALGTWYELTSSALSKSLRALTKPPLDFVSLSEDPESGREKWVSLTSNGKRFTESMIQNGTAYISTMVERLTDAEIESGVHFLSRVTEIHKELQEEAARESGDVESPEAVTSAPAKRA